MENIPCKKEIAIIFAIVAQWLEHRSRKAEVEGSNPFGGLEAPTTIDNTYILQNIGFSI